MENAAPFLRSEIELGKAYVRNFLSKNEEKQHHCYCKSDESFMNRKQAINKRQERRFGTCKPDPKTNPQFLDSILKSENHVMYDKEMVDFTSEIQDISQTNEFEKSEKIFKYFSTENKDAKSSELSENSIETEKKDFQSKRCRSKNNKKEEREEEEGNMFQSPNCKSGFPLFLTSRVSVPVPDYCDTIEYCEEVKHQPLNVFSVALYFLCFFVMYIFMSFRL